MQQRFNWYYNSAYTKPLLSREPMHWLHSRVDAQTNEDSSPFLIQLHRMDYNICLQGHQQPNALLWNKRDGRNWGYQNRIVEEEHFCRGYYEDSCSGIPIHVEAMPEFWRFDLIYYTLNR